MTWNPLKKVTLQHPSSSQSLGIEDGDLDRKVASLQVLEEASRNLYKETKKYRNTLDELHQCELRTSLDLSKCDACQRRDDLRKLAEEYHSVVTQSEKTVQDLENICQNAVVEPLKKYTTTFTHVQTNLKKREQTLQECYRNQQRVGKYTGKERTGPNVAKLSNARRAFEQSKDEVRSQNGHLHQEIPHIHNARIEYFQPSLEALIRGQINYYGETIKLYSDLGEQSKLTRPLSDSQYQQLVQQKLADIRALSIVADD